MNKLLKNVPIYSIEETFSKGLNDLTGYVFRVRIKEINFETGETILEVHVVDQGEPTPGDI